MEGAPREVVVVVSTQEGAAVALAAIGHAGMGMVADGRARPHVVQRPDDRFGALEYLLQVAERQHALVDPVEVDDVGLTECPCAGDVETGVGDGDGKEVPAVEAVAEGDDEPFPQEAHTLLPATADADDMRAVAGAVQDHQRRLDPIVTESLGEPSGSDRRTAHGLGCADKEYFHREKGMFIDYRTISLCRIVIFQCVN